jgi:hypothetical protein
MRGAFSDEIEEFLKGFEIPEAKAEIVLEAYPLTYRVGLPDRWMVSGGVGHRSREQLQTALKGMFSDIDFLFVPLSRIDVIEHLAACCFCGCDNHYRDSANLNGSWACGTCRIIRGIPFGHP